MPLALAVNHVNGSGLDLLDVFSNLAYLEIGQVHEMSRFLSDAEATCVCCDTKGALLKVAKSDNGGLLLVCREAERGLRHLHRPVFNRAPVAELIRSELERRDLYRQRAKKLLTAVLGREEVNKTQLRELTEAMRRPDLG